jgi:putative transposase
MTDDRIALCQLVEKSSGAWTSSSIRRSAAKPIIARNRSALTGAAYGERAPDRLAQRNGYRDRVWETRAGTV